MPSQASTILIAESGATKTEWRYVQGKRVIGHFQSKGFNPNTQPAETLHRNLTAAAKQSGQDIQPDSVRFYGAGLGREHARQQVFAILHDALPTADIHVYTDLLAAVHSTNRAQGLVGILGTGSNACLFREGEVEETRGGLGYLLGDEGSGVDLGRTLLKALLEEQIPPPLAKRLWESLDTDRQGIIQQVYSAERPHAYLASVMPVFHPFRNEPTIRKHIIGRFLAYLDTTVCLWSEHKEWPLDVVGGIAHSFQGCLQEACSLRGITLGKTDPAPIEGLVAYYKERV